MWTRRKLLLASAHLPLGLFSPSARAVSLPGSPLLSPLSDAPSWQQLESFAGAITRQNFEEAYQKIYSDGINFPPPWKLEQDVLTIETTPGTPPVRVPLAKDGTETKTAPRYWRSAGQQPPLAPGDPPLRGIHIAIDPGHIGGDYAQMEERWLTMDEGATIVMEGNLVLEVANLLKPRLEALGAQVSLVRSQNAPVSTAKLDDFRALALTILTEAGIANPPETYHSRLDDSRILSVRWQTEKLFYRVSEIRARAQRVNQELRPDLVLCLHLNAEAWGNPQKPAFVEKNHFHLLLNGCYSAGELQYEDVRFEMLGRLFTRTHEEELALSDSVANETAHATRLPAYVYTTKNARRVSGNPFVYVRNLLASRLYQCPVLYFEPYVMNHEQTYKRLTLGHYLGRTLLGGELVTSPLEDYTRGVLRGLTRYYSQARRSA